MGKRAYIAGPITKGPLERNIRNAIDVANILLHHGHYPFIPHLYCFVQMVHEHHYERWMEMDFAFILACDALIRIPGESAGADREVEFATKHGIPVFYYLDKFLTWANENHSQVRELAADISGVEPTSK